MRIFKTSIFCGIVFYFQYRGLELSNGLRMLLISDPHTDKSAASMDVNVGMYCISFYGLIIPANLQIQ